MTTTDGQGAWMGRHAAYLESQTANADRNTAYLSFRMHVAPSSASAPFPRSTDTLSTFRTIIAKYRWRPSGETGRSGPDFFFKSGTDGNVFVRANGTIEYQQLYHDPKQESGDRPPVPLPDIFADIYSGLLIAEEAYTSLVNYSEGLYIGVSLVNVFDRSMYLPSDVQTFFDGEPTRSQAAELDRWIYHGQMRIGEDPILATRIVIQDLFWNMGYTDFEAYLRRWGKAKERSSAENSGLATETADEVSTVAQAPRVSGSSSAPRESSDSQDRGVIWIAPDPNTDQAPTRAPVSDAPSYLATILFTDIVDSSGHSQRLGDSRWIDVLRAHDTIIRESVMRYGGNVVKHTGDGVLATFASPTAAVVAACEASRAVRTSDLGLEIRAGLHIGECELTPDDIFGIAVNVAQRVMSQAGPSEVVVSETVRDVTQGLSQSRGIQYGDLEPHELKGFGSRNLCRAEVRDLGDAP